MNDLQSLRNKARRAGIFYLLMIPLGVFGILYPLNLIIQGDIEATISNIVADQFLFRLSILSALLVQVVQIFLVFFLYKLFETVNKNWAVLMVLLILVAVPIAMLNEVNQFAILLLLDNPGEQRSLISLFIDLHNHGVIIAQIFWGLWLFPMGYLAYKSGFIPKIIGILLMIGCFGYLLDSFLYIIIPDFGTTFSEYTSIGEIVMAFWLVIKGVKTPTSGQ